MRAILLLFSISALMGLSQLPSLQGWMQWDHNAIMTGQWWRIVTGNLTHTNLYHLSMNVLGLWIISFIFHAHIEARQFLLVFISLCLSVAAYFYLPQCKYTSVCLGYCTGLFAFYALVEYRLGRKNNALLLIGLTAKILWEQWFGSATGSEALIGAKVAIDAHLFGAISGTIFAVSIRPKQVKGNK